MVKRVGEMRSPYTDHKTSKYCVAYLDVLGSKDIICNDKNNEHLNILNMIFEDTISEVKIAKKIDNKDFFLKIFSDNIILAIKTENEDRTENIKFLLLLVSSIIDEFLDYGYLTRGAIVEGDFFCNDTLVYGKALIDVVELEEKYAIYPRIIVQESVKDVFPICFCKGADGWDVFNNYFFNDNGFSHVNFKISLLELLKKNKNNKKILPKIMWTITYFNEYNNWKKQNKKINYSIITDEEISEALK